MTLAFTKTQASRLPAPLLCANIRALFPHMQLLESGSPSVFLGTEGELQRCCCSQSAVVVRASGIYFSEFEK